MFNNEPMFDKKQAIQGHLFWQIQLQVTHRQAHSDRWVTARQKSSKPVMTSMVEFLHTSPTYPECVIGRPISTNELADQHTKIVIEDMRKRGELENTVIYGWETTVAVRLAVRLPLRGQRFNCPLYIRQRNRKRKVVNDLASGSRPGNHRFSRH